MAELDCSLFQDTRHHCFEPWVPRRLLLPTILKDPPQHLSCWLPRHVSRAISDPCHGGQWTYPVGNVDHRQCQGSSKATCPRLRGVGLLWVRALHDCTRVHLLRQPPSGVPFVTVLCRPNLVPHDSTYMCPKGIPGRASSPEAVWGLGAACVYPANIQSPRQDGKRARTNGRATGEG
uniref:Uncharacterized protein n=1 Tax=Photinus pyralis TaxID=7054 RepID=A0A1Y1M834_PHOPY